MINITLTKEEYEKLIKLEEGEILELTYKGLNAYITPDEYGNVKYKDRYFTFNFNWPSEAKLHIKK